MFGRRSRRELETHILRTLSKELSKKVKELQQEVEQLKQSNRKDCEQLKAENMKLHEKIKYQDTIVREFMNMLELGNCNDCAKNHTKACTFLPRLGETVRINCPHYTKAEVRT